MDNQAERMRLQRMLVNGPWRRMAQDRALGMSPQRADMDQARAYRLRLEWLDRGGDDVSELVEVTSGDVLALDRTERD